MVEVIRALRREHANLAGLLDELERQIGIFEDGGAPDYDVIGCVVEYCLDFPDQCHHPKEDLIYRELAALSGDVAGPIGDLQAEHVVLADRTRRVAELIDRVLSEAEMPSSHLATAVRAFLDTYRRHMESEETVFFPAALANLGEADWNEVEAEIAARQDPLFGERVEKRFAALRKFVLEPDDQSATG